MTDDELEKIRNSTMLHAISAIVYSISFSNLGPGIHFTNDYVSIIVFAIFLCLYTLFSWAMRSVVALFIAIISILLES